MLDLGFMSSYNSRMTQLSERNRPSGLPEQPLIAEVGKTFRPFEGIRLPVPNDSKEFVETVDYVGAREISVKGAVFSLALLVPGRVDVFDPFDFIPKKFEAPLGAPTVEYRLPTKDSRKWESLRTPIELGTFSVSTLDQYYTLKAHQLELKIGESVYYMECVMSPGDDTPEEVIENDDVGYFVNNEGVVTVEGDITSVLLPYDEEGLSKIEARVVFRGQHSLSI